MFLAFIGLVFTGFPIAWILAGLAVLFTALAIVFEVDLGIRPASIGATRASAWNESGT